MKRLLYTGFVLAIVAMLTTATFAQGLFPPKPVHVGSVTVWNKAGHPAAVEIWTGGNSLKLRSSLCLLPGQSETYATYTIPGVKDNDLRFQVKALLRSSSCQAQVLQTILGPILKLAQFSHSWRPPHEVFATHEKHQAFIEGLAPHSFTLRIVTN